MRAVLHYHKCRCCDADSICTLPCCAVRGSNSERDWVCFTCRQNGRALLDQFTAGLATILARESHAIRDRAAAAIKPVAVGILLLLSLFAVSSRADSITDLAGTIHEPGITYTYSFSVQTIDFPTYVEEILNGTMSARGSGHPSHSTFADDTYFFGYSESMVLLAFGAHPTWALLATANSVSLVDPPAGGNVATPEPSTADLLIASALGILLGLIALVHVKKRNLSKL